MSLSDRRSYLRIYELESEPAQDSRPIADNSYNVNSIYTFNVFLFLSIFLISPTDCITLSLQKLFLIYEMSSSVFKTIKHEFYQSLFAMRLKQSIGKACLNMLNNFY